MRTAPPALWTDPQVGDVCTTSRGRTRTVRSVLRDEVGGLLVPLKVTHEDADGTIATIAAGTWATRCELAWTRGGTYERGGDA